MGEAAGRQAAKKVLNPSFRGNQLLIAREIAVEIRMLRMVDKVRQLFEPRTIKIKENNE